MLSILSDPAMTEFINGAFVVVVALGIRTVWMLNARVASLETDKTHLLTKTDFKDEMDRFRKELKVREDDIIERVQYMLSHTINKS